MERAARNNAPIGFSRSDRQTPENVRSLDVKRRSPAAQAAVCLALATGLAIFPDLSLGQAGPLNSAGWNAPGFVGLAPGRASGLIVRDGQAQGYGNPNFDPDLSRKTDGRNGYAVPSGFAVRFGDPVKAAPLLKPGRDSSPGARARRPVAAYKPK